MYCKLGRANAAGRREFDMTTTSLPLAASTRYEPVYTPAATLEPAWVRALLIGIALIFLTLFLFVPLAAVFFEAFKKGWHVYLAAITEDDAISAIKLTLIASAIAVPLNLV